MGEGKSPVKPGRLWSLESPPSSGRKAAATARSMSSTVAPTRKQRRAEAKQRAKFIRAAMPNGPKSPSEMRRVYLEAQTASSRSKSSPPRGALTDRSPSPSAPSSVFPWEMKIPPPRRLWTLDRYENVGVHATGSSPALVEECNGNPASGSPMKSRWLETGSRLSSQISLKEAERQAATAAAEEKIAVARAKAEEKARIKALADAKDAEIAAAVKQAEEAAASAPPKTSAELKREQKERVAKRQELTVVLNDIKLEREASLTVRLGEAMERRGIMAFELMKEWDTNGDGELDRIEFRQALRQTLKLKVTNAQSDELFDSLDEDGDGCLLIQTEVKPAIRKIHTFCKAEHERETKAQQQVDLCTSQIKSLEECTVATNKWEDMKRQLDAMQAQPSFEVRVGEVVEQKLCLVGEEGGMSMPDIVTSWGGSADGTVGKDELLRAYQVLRNAGDYGLAETNKDILVDIFDASATMTGDMTEPRLDVAPMLTKFVAAADSIKGKMTKLAATVRRLEEKARALQVDYARKAARNEKTLEIEARMSAEPKLSKTTPETPVPLAAGTTVSASST